MMKAISIHNKKSQCCSLSCKGLSWEFDYRSCILEVANMEMGTLFLESRQQTKTLKRGRHIWKERPLWLMLLTSTKVNTSDFIFLFFSWIRSGYTWRSYSLSESPQNTEISINQLTRLTRKYSVFFATSEWYNRTKESNWHRKLGLISQIWEWFSEQQDAEAEYITLINFIEQFYVITIWVLKKY